MCDRGGGSRMELGKSLTLKLPVPPSSLPPHILYLPSSISNSISWEVKEVAVVMHGVGAAASDSVQLGEISPIFFYCPIFLWLLNRHGKEVTSPSTAEKLQVLPPHYGLSLPSIGNAWGWHMPPLKLALTSRGVGSIDWCPLPTPHPLPRSIGTISVFSSGTAGVSNQPLGNPLPPASWWSAAGGPPPLTIGC